MPLRRDPLLERFEPFRKLGHNPFVGYGTAIAAVAASIGLRYAFGVSMAPGPLIQFYLAVIITTVVGRVPAGILASGLSIIAAAYFLFLDPGPSTLSRSASVGVLVMYIAGFAAIVAVIGLLFDLLDRLQGEEDKLRFLLNAGPVGILSVDEEGTITVANNATEKLFAYGPGELLGRKVEELVPNQLRGSHEVQRASYQRSPSARVMGAGRDLDGQRRDGTLIPLEIGLNPIERDGRRGTLATILDVTERRLAEKRQQVLLHEVQHRARNALQVLQIVAKRIFVPDRPVRESLQRFIGVVNALARTQDLLGSKQGATLSEILEAELAAFPGQSTLEGPPLILARHAAQELSLITHELAINATKHGALSSAEGRISAEWKDEGGFVTLLWRETGGPAVATPLHRGFGRVVLEDLAKEMGEVSISYEGGLRYQLKAPRARILEQALERVA